MLLYSSPQDFALFCLKHCMLQRFISKQLPVPSASTNLPSHCCFWLGFQVGFSASCSIFFIHAFPEGCLSCSRPLAIMSNAAMNMGMQVSFHYPAFIFFGDIPCHGIAGTYGSSVFNFLRTLLTLFHYVPICIIPSKYTVLLSPQPQQLTIFYLLDNIGWLFPSGFPNPIKLV